MEAKDKLIKLNEKVTSSLETWIEDRIDEFVGSNPKLKMASVYMKRGAKNYLAREKGKIGNMIDSAALFICDENGDIDAEMLFDDMMTMFREMEETPFNMGIFNGAIGKGMIRFQLPNNPIFNLLFGDTGAIKITDSDFVELKNLITK